MTAQPANMNALTDAVRDSAAREIAILRRDAARERELRDAQFAARMAEFETRLASVAELERRLAERLAAVKDGEAGRDGADGASVSVDVVRGMVTAECERILATWERPQDGRSLTVEDVAPMISESVAAAIAALPPAERGPQGEQGPQGERGEAGFALDDFDTELIEDGRTLLMKFIRGDTALVHEIPLPAGPQGPQGERGEDGKSIAPDDVRELIAGLIESAVATIPPPEKGEPGERGPEGPVGKLPAVAAWEDRVHYDGEVVTRDGSVFQAIRDTGKEPWHEDWRCIVAAGRNGEDGRSPTVRTTFDPGEAYRELDIVALNGAAFIARRDDPGLCPGEGWQLMSSQGKQGKPGERGASIKGDRGPAGAPVVRAAVDDDGLMILTNGDGSTIELDLYPLLSKLG